MRMRALVWMASAVALAGCSSLGPGDYNAHVPEVPVTVSEVQRAVACEFAYALDGTDGEAKKALGNWGAFVELMLVVKDGATLSPGVGQFSAKFGNTTVSTGTALPGMTLSGSVQDKNTMAYFVGIKENAASAKCPPQDSTVASSGLELADFLLGAGLVINSGGRIASSGQIITSAGVNVPANAVVTSGTIFPTAVAAPRELIPTIKYERTFTVSRKAGGGLNFKVGDVTLTLTGSDAGRERKDNTLTITMGARSAEVIRDDGLEGVDTPSEPKEISLEDSIFQNREDQVNQYNSLRGAAPNEVIIVNPPAGP